MRQKKMKPISSDRLETVCRPVLCTRLLLRVNWLRVLIFGAIRFNLICLEGNTATTIATTFQPRSDGMDCPNLGRIRDGVLFTPYLAPGDSIRNVYWNRTRRSAI